MYKYISMFTLTKEDNEEQTRVCRIEGGLYNDKIIYLDANENSDEIEYKDPYDLLDEDFFKVKNYTLMNVKEREQIKNQLMNMEETDEDIASEDENDDESVESNDSDIEDVVRQYVKKAKDVIKKKKKYDISFHDETKLLICPTTLPERVYISGQNGSGKSYLSGIYAKQYNRLFPRNKIIIFSVHEKDKAYDDVKRLIRVDLTDESLTESFIDVKKFKNTLVIFDDCDRIQDKNLKKYLDNLELDLLTNGRKYGIYMLTLSHMLMNYKATREKINECSRVIMFGQSGSKYHISRFLRIHGGLSRYQIKRVFELPSRWFCISLNYPSYILYEKGVYLLSHDNEPKKNYIKD